MRTAYHTVCALIFVWFNVCILADQQPSANVSSTKIWVSMNTHETILMVSQMMTSCIENSIHDNFYIHQQQTPFSCFASSFATVHFVLVGCGACIPSLSVPKRGSVSDLENNRLIVSHSMAALLPLSKKQPVQPFHISRFPRSGYE